jgi:hypothetical protein
MWTRVHAPLSVDGDTVKMSADYQWCYAFAAAGFLPVDFAMISSSIERGARS